jgi:hypothetical protein
MSGATYNDVDSFGNLKELYAEDSHYQENVVSSFFNFIRHADDGEVEFDGKNYNIAVVLQHNESYGALNDDERIPDSDFPKGVFAKYGPKRMYSGVEATTFAATRGHKHGRVDGKYLDDMIRGTLLTFMSNLDSDALGNGRGYRATVATATAAQTSFTVDFSGRLRPGMKLDWYDSTLATKRGSIKIALRGIDRVNRTVYVDTTFGSAAVPTGAAADDVLVVYGALAAGEPSDGRHILGYDRICDNSVSIGTLSPTDYAAWTATNQAAGGGNPTQEILQVQSDLMKDISGLYPDAMAFNSAWKRGYLSGFLNQRMFTSNSFDTGASSLTFSAVRMGEDESKKKPKSMKMLEDKNMDPSKVNIFSSSAFCVASDYSDAPHLADEDGSEMRFRPGYDAMFGFYRYWANVVVKQRNAIGQITGFATPSSVV